MKMASVADTALNHHSLTDMISNGIIIDDVLFWGMILNNIMMDVIFCGSIIDVIFCGVSEWVSGG